MRFSLKIAAPLAVALGIMAFLSMEFVETMTSKWFQRDLELRSQLVFKTLREALNSDPALDVMQGAFKQAVTDERLYALGYCDHDGKLAVATKLFPKQIECAGEATSGVIIPSRRGDLFVQNLSVAQGDSRRGELVVVHDASFIRNRGLATRWVIFYFFLALGVLISLLTGLIAHFSRRGWVRALKSMIKRKDFMKGSLSTRSRAFSPILREVRALMRDLDSAQGMRDESQISWSAKSLKEILRRDLAGDEILILSNREPYIHDRRGEEIDVRFPASGLITALEPVMRACSGTWIAHGSGSADRDVVDDNDRVRVPPEDPKYQIRRIWLTEKEENGYYYGFSNEGLWPLCHIAHTRPAFRTEDWRAYQKINRRFADAVVKEARTRDPVVLVQDYHLALAPRMIREDLPEATIITFWHIPWPNSESFSICPWREEILEGLLGSSIVGFHTRYHCNHFLDSVDRFLESRIDRDLSTITYGGKITAVHHYPISIDWPDRWLEKQKSIGECRQVVRERHQLPASVRVGIGVDRLDYTKGIIERFNAVDRFLDLHPEWKGKFCFIQIAAPSRSKISRYREFSDDVKELCRRINRKHTRNGVAPLLVLLEHHEPEEVFEYFRAADLCFVGSLHDGMNIVAKEFVASREDEEGVLILSHFAGAARELVEALIVNPYDADQCAESIHMALLMSRVEQKDRMRAMRALVREFNVFRWAGRMLLDARRARQRQRLQKKFMTNETHLRASKR